MKMGSDDGADESPGEEPISIDAEGEVDVEDIMRQIREHIARRQGQTVSLAPPPPRNERVGGEIYAELHQANTTFDKAYVFRYVTPSHLPLIGGVWQRVREAAHDLVIFYVNRLAAAQIRFNHHVVRLLNELVRYLSEDDTAARLARLEEEVAALRARLEQ